MDPRLLETLSKPVCWLTPTRRLALQLRQAANAYFARSQKVWPTPVVFSLEDWLMTLWAQFEIRALSDRLLLTPMQSLLQWEIILKDFFSGRALYYIDHTAKMAWQAWCLLHEWKALALLTRPGQGEEAAFSEWAMVYQAWLDKNQFLDQAKLLEAIIHLLENHAPPQCLVFYGFEELTPSLLEAIERLEKKGWEMILLSPLPLFPRKITRYSFQDSQSECKAAARWAKALLEQGEAKIRIAVVVPHLVQYRDQIKSVFTDILDPLAVCDPVAQVSRYFNISAAMPLTDYSIIQSAMDCLKIGLSSFSLSEYKAILLSPFIKAREESEKYTELQMLSKKLSLAFSLKEVLTCTSDPLWEKTLCDIQEKICPFTMALSKWAAHFQMLLNCLGWPGERSLTSIEHQVVKRWLELLEELRLYDHILPPLHFKSALAMLRKCASHVPFQPENKQAPIQILGVLEAAGQHFDYLWVMGLHSEAWPPLVQPNPFIAISEQRERKMPHASLEKEIHYARKITARFKESAKEIIFSSPLSENGKTLYPSALIKDISLSDLLENEREERERCEALYEAIKLEKIEDKHAPPLLPEEGIRGSSTLLALQAACPFKAFAEIRLGVKRESPPTLWLTAALEGTILHKILEKWEPSKNLSLEEVIKGTLDLFSVKEAPSLYQEVEKARLKMIIESYCQLEENRSPFTIVATEYKKSFDFSGLCFHLRIDRLDRDEEGNLLIVDYKTGHFTIKDWEGARPKAPQLPLYALALEAENPQALIVIKLNTKKCEYEGIFTGLKVFFPEWKAHLGNLTRAFLEGDAVVDPLPEACRYCQLGPFCRIKEDE